MPSRKNNNNNQFIELKKKIIKLEWRLTQSEAKNELLKRRITLVESENNIKNETQEQLEHKVKTLIIRDLDISEAVKKIDKSSWQSKVFGKWQKAAKHHRQIKVALYTLQS